MNLQLLKRLDEEGLKTFDSKVNFDKWMNTSWEFLNDRKPKDCLENEKGIKRITNILIQIRHGIFA
ncbi:antitoxin Xre/MbcA/ParS toxin-binding domain-containing protein [Ekhidna sp.]|uniref:antitoxin Xre/MbcA/ParS toxin-binding domain-containing protein n=1 Tax=Ekhidna sp. TaxID=2608089 RepID=UPI003CCBF885